MSCFATLFQVTAQASTPLERPAALAADIEFWRRVYGEITTSQGFIHDSARLDIIYATVNLSKGNDRSRYSSAVAADEQYVAALRAVAGGKREGLSSAEQRVVNLWGPDLNKAVLLAASERVRFQLGQSDRFREGIIRSGAWEAYVKKAIADADLPTEIAALPHVESSYNPAAYSKVGAAGMWQFMQSTGKRFMRIDNVMDERLDPYHSTRSAILLLKQNYQVTQSWPLAITAYNHGASGMRRAIAELGTDDITTIVREYKGRTFGFASRNFYVSFLAAVEVADKAEYYFGKLSRDPPDMSAVVKMPSYIDSRTLIEALGVSETYLARMNPSLSAVVWRGSKHIPQGFDLRLPTTVDDPTVFLASVPASAWRAEQIPDLFHIVQKGETLSAIAPRYGARVSDLIAINSLTSRAFIRTGQKLILPAGVAASAGPAVNQGIYPAQADAGVASVAEPGGAASVGVLVSAPTTQTATASADVSEVEAQVEVEMAVVDAQSSQSDFASDRLDQPRLLADPNDYSVAKDQTIRIQEGETIGHYADWLGIRASDIRRVNAMRNQSGVRVGRRLKLEFTKATPGEFEAARILFHQSMQEQFFAQHLIVGTAEHLVRSGESIWVLAERRYEVPVWLLRQYNPDLDLENVKPDTRVIIPVLSTVIS
ncbi:MAG: transglycosylase SLT domain-containing protein [Proteobacteria bacterium]|nr:transglycosylase SLT domain-containing protein [Pseudomonadota bacterium]